MPQLLYFTFSLQTNNSGDNSSSIWVGLIIGLIIVLIVVFFIAIASSQGKPASAKETKIQQLHPKKVVEIGTYLWGLKKTIPSNTLVTCAILEKEFVFLKASSNIDEVEVDRIKRDTVYQFVWDTKLQIPHHNTLGNSLESISGVLANTNNTSKMENYCLMIDCGVNNDDRRNAFFEFVGAGSKEKAKNAASLLNRYTKVSVDEKNCPNCTAKIKREATYCTHCNKSLGSTQ